MLEKHLNFAKYHASSFHKANEIEISVVEELRGLLVNIFHIISNMSYLEAD